MMAARIKKQKVRIGICGPRGVGKSTTALALEDNGSVGLLIQNREMENRPFKYQELHNLHSSYEGLSTIFSIPRQFLEAAKSKDDPFNEKDAPTPKMIGMTRRQILDNHGVYMRELYGDDVFIKLWHRTVDAMSGFDLQRVFLNTSVRFDCEAEGHDAVIELVREGVDYDGSRYNTRINPDLITHRCYLQDGDTDLSAWALHHLIEKIIGVR